MCLVFNNTHVKNLKLQIKVFYQNILIFKSSFKNLLEIRSINGICIIFVKINVFIGINHRCLWINNCVELSSYGPIGSGQINVG